MSALDILNVYIHFFEKRNHKRIENSSLVPQNDPTTLFTSSGMQPIIKYLLGKPHPEGKRLVNVQNCFRAQDIDEIGDNRHTTFFRMLGNWSLGDYFKNEEIPWFWEFLTGELKLDPKRLYVSVFGGYKDIEKDNLSASIWKSLFERAGIDSEGRIFYCGVEENWWSRSGTPDNMPAGEPGGPDTEVYFDLKPNERKPDSDLSKNIDSGRFLEIGNSVFMTYQKSDNGDFVELPQKNVDFGGGLERLVAATELKEDIFQTSLFWPIIKSVERVSSRSYHVFQKQMRIVTDHLIASSFLIADGVIPSNKQQGSVLRGLIRRSLENFSVLEIKDPVPILQSVINQYESTDPQLIEKYEKIKLTILEEQQAYKSKLDQAIKFVYKTEGIREGDELKGDLVNISAGTAFKSLASLGVGPTQLKSLGFKFDEQELAEEIKKHQNISRKSVKEKFKK